MFGVFLSANNVKRNLFYADRADFVQISLLALKMGYCTCAMVKIS